MIQIPDFLKPERNKKENLSKVTILINEYNEKFGRDSWSTEGIDLSDLEEDEEI